MTGSDFEVAPEALDEIAVGIETVLDGLRGLGPPGAAQRGRGVEELAALPGDVGPTPLNPAFAAFCLRWEWGVRAAVQDGEDLVDGLRAAVTTYGRADDEQANVFARVAFDLLGDPAGEGDTWADVAAARRPDPRPLDPAVLAASWDDAAHAFVTDSWAATVVRALRGDPPPDPLDDLRPITG